MATSTPAPTPAPTTPPITIAPTEAPRQVTNFVLRGQVSSDLQAIAESGTPVGNLLASKLKIEQECDYQDLLVKAAADVTSPSALGTYINANLRGNISTTTQLKSATRLFFNPASQMKNTSQKVIRRLDTELNHDLEIAYAKSLVGHLESTPPPFTIVDGALVFTRPALLMLVFSARWGVWDGATTINGQMPVELNGSGDPANWAMKTPTWRFTSSGTNRTVSLQPTFTISGGLSTGQGDVKLQPQMVMFQEQDIVPYTPIVQETFQTLEVLRGSGVYGRVEKLKIQVERTPYVAFFGAASDALGLFKTTVSGQDDTSNFLDIIEL